MARFPDHFSSLAGGYARYRPGYPASLFAWLAELAPNRRYAWDCATGSGQAAGGLAPHFKRVVASEASLSQLLRAPRAAGVRYVNALAERSGLAGASVALVAVAQALHWLDFDAFWAEARRVLVPEGVVAVWGYELLTVDPDPKGRISAAIDRYYREVVGPYWPPERRWVEDRYRSIPFPFEEIQAPRVVSETRWTRDHLLGYLGTWSAGKRYREERGSDPRDEVVGELETAWPEGRERRVYWDLFLRVGRIR